MQSHFRDLLCQPAKQLGQLTTIVVGPVFYLF
jgi:hypothetical protein